MSDELHIHAGQTSASLLGFLIAALVSLAISFAAILISFWPERVFKCSDLNWWRRAALTLALAWTLGVLTEGEASVVKFFSADFQSERIEISVNAILLFVRAIILLLPLFLLSRLRETIDFRPRGSWIALIFIIPVFIGPSIVGKIGARSWSDNTLILVFFLLIGFTEELVFRGYAFQLRPDRRPKETIIVTSIVFALAHLPQYSHNPEFSFFCARAFFLGIGLGIVRLATGSIGLAIVIHGVVNFVIEQNDSPSNQPVWFAFGVSAMAALYFHPCCRPIAESKPQDLCGTNT